MVRRAWMHGKQRPHTGLAAAASLLAIAIGLPLALGACGGRG